MVALAVRALEVREFYKRKARIELPIDPASVRCIVYRQPLVLGQLFVDLSSVLFRPIELDTFGHHHVELCLVVRNERLGRFPVIKSASSGRQRDHHRHTRRSEKGFEGHIEISKIRCRKSKSQLPASITQSPPATGANIPPLQTSLDTIKGAKSRATHVGELNQRKHQ